MKSNVTKFDLDAAFKALDEIEIPKVPGLKANRPNLHESVKRVDRLSMLVEDYYNVNDQDEMIDAKSDREEDIAKAKLDRIERIVDLDADSPDDILPSYVGKTIIQCPTCLTLFYKNPEDIEENEENPDLVNIGEVCQHCGNDTGYNVIGKVAADESEQEEAPAEELNNEQAEESTEDKSTEEQPEEQTEEKAEDTDSEENLDLNLDNLEEVPVEEEKKEESFSASNGDVLNEEVDVDLNNKLEEHNEYIKYLQDQIDKEEKALESEKNEFVRNNIEECIEALKAKLEEAIPDEVKASEETDTAEETEEEIKEEPVKDIPEENSTEETEIEIEEPVEEELKESLIEEDAASELAKFAASLDGINECGVVKEDVVSDLDNFANSLDEWKLRKEDKEELAECGDKQLTEEHADGVSNAEFRDMLHNPLYYIKEDVEDIAAEPVVVDPDADDFVEDDTVDFDEIVDEDLNFHVTKYLKEVYSNVNNFTATSCEMPNKNKLIIEGVIKFNSGKTKNSTFTFEKDKGCKFVGCNESLANGKAFTLEYKLRENKLEVRNLKYNYSIDNTLVEGYTNG